jgi:hypothetical protein
VRSSERDSLRRELGFPTFKSGVAHGRKRDVPARVQHGSHRRDEKGAAFLRTASAGAEPEQQLQKFRELIYSDTPEDQSADN